MHAKIVIRILTHRHRFLDPLVAAAVVHKLVDRDLAVVVEVHRLGSSEQKIHFRCIMNT